VELVDEILGRHGLRGPAAPCAAQGKDSTAYATAQHVVKIPHAERRDQVDTEAIVGPAAHAAGVRTPVLVAWAHEADLAYTVWERVPVVSGTCSTGGSTTGTTTSSTGGTAGGSSTGSTGSASGGSGGAGGQPEGVMNFSCGIGTRGPARDLLSGWSLLALLALGRRSRRR
jgi:hypothetical protein